MDGKEGSSYYFSLEGIRGIAAILVAIRHLDSLFSPIRSQTSFLAVDIFFLLSGFVIAGNYEQKLRRKEITSVEFFTLRIIRIYPLYIFGSLIGGILLAHQTGALGFGIILTVAKAAAFFPTLASATPLYPLDHPAWSLFAELAMCVFYGGWMSRATNLTVVAITTLSGGLLLAGIWVHGSADIGFQAKWFVFGLFRIGFSFGVGVLIYRHKEKIRNHIPILHNNWTILIFLIVFILLSAPIHRNMVLIYSIISVFIIFPIIMVVAIQCQPSDKVKKISIWLGRLSFPLYVFHVPLGDAISSTTQKLFLVSPDSYAPGSGILILITISFITLLLSRYLEEPFRRYLKNKLFAKRKEEKKEISFSS